MKQALGLALNGRQRSSFGTLQVPRIFESHHSNRTADRSLQMGSCGLTRMSGNFEICLCRMYVRGKKSENRIHAQCQLMAVN